MKKKNTRLTFSGEWLVMRSIALCVNMFVEYILLYRVATSSPSRKSRAHRVTLRALINVQRSWE